MWPPRWENELVSDEGLVEFLRVCYGDLEREVTDMGYVWATSHDGVQSPTAVLRRVEAGRAILAAYETAVRAAETDCTRWRAGEVFGLRGTLEILAAEFSDRPGYQEEWAP